MNRHLFCACCLVSVVLGICQVAMAGTATYLPVGRSWVQDDKSLAIPCGIGVNYYYQRQGYDLNTLKLDPDIGRQFNLVPSDLSVKSRVNEVNIKLDTWLLPFLNLFGILGRVEQVTKISDIPYPPLSTLEYEDDGYIYGGGATLAYGVKYVWASLTVADTYADLSNEDSWINAIVVTPRVGVRADTPWEGKGLNIWVGAMFQEVDEEHTGSWNVPGIGQLKYDAKLKEKEPWNFIAGLSTDLWGRVGLEVEAGVGEREQLLTSLSYRF
ncbi:MAG: hypothetical protein PHW60_01345 [Kiritimatiellae bacterium]|nr:hypothetical protein [Kiritimatiellia bacterium]